MIVEKPNPAPPTVRSWAFAKFDQVLGKHHFTEQMNYTNVHVNSTNPLSLSTSLPSNTQLPW